MSEGINKSEDLWSSYKTLKKVLWKHLSEETGSECSTSELETTLRKHKQNFFALLQNQPKNSKSREELKKGMDDGIAIRGLGHQILSKELYQETIILSDMYDLNEYAALDLLCTAQTQMIYHPGLPRGLVAILLYYDGRKSLVSSLRYLVQARSGVQWSLNVKPNIERFITAYTDQLMNGGLFSRIFDLLRTLDLTKELQKLQENLALGSARHRRQVVDLFKDIRVILADIVFTWAAQSGLPKIPTLALINHLKQTEIQEEASGKIDDVTLYLQMALLSALDLSVLHTREDGEEVVQALPILSDPDFLNSVINELAPNKPKWKCEGLQAVSTFGLAVCISSLWLVPQNQGFQEAISREEIFIDHAIELNVFHFLHNTVLENNTLFTETFLCKRMHTLLTDFIVYMYPKVKELRIKADEIARTIQIYTREGLDSPANLPRCFEFLLLTIAKFYSNKNIDPEYVSSFWSPTEINSAHYSGERSTSRAVSLFKFIRVAGDMIPATLFVPYLTMLSGLSTSPQAARHCFNMLKQVGPQLSTTLSWDHFFMSFAQYYKNLRQEMPPVSDTVYRSSYLKGVSPLELEGLHAVLLLTRTIADHDEFSRLALCEHPSWAPLTILLGLVGCSVPIPLKAELLLTLASLAKSPENAAQMWENLESSQIVVTVPTTSSYAPRGLQTELDEVESRLETYPLTKALLTLLDVLTDFGIPRTLGAGPRKPGFDPYLSFIVNSVFLKFHTRSYRNAAEKWQIANVCLKLFEKFLNQYDPQVSDFPKSNSGNEFNSPPGYHLMIQLNNKSELLHVILDIIDEGNRLFDSYVTHAQHELIAEATLLSLNVIHAALALQNKFAQVLVAAASSVPLTHLNKLLLTINRKSGKPDHCVNIAKFMGYQPYLQKHAMVVVKILVHITSTTALHGLFVNVLFTAEARDDVRNGFVYTLDCDYTEDDADAIVRTKLEALKLLKQCLAYNAPNLSHFLFGFDIGKPISRTEFQYSGVLNVPRSCTHALVSMTETELLKTSSNVSESAYETLFLLASNDRTYAPCLRFLRLHKRYFINHLSGCLKRLGNGQDSAFNQIAWLLKTLAVEIKICSKSKQVSYLRELCNFLVSLPQIDDANAVNQDPFNSTYSDQKNSTGPNVFTDRITKNFMVGLIPYFEYKPDDIPAPEWQFFDGKVLNALLEHCTLDNASKSIDVKLLHQRLYEEIKLLQGTAVLGQIQLIGQEVPKVLKYALDLNRNKERYAAVVHFVDGWRQVVEILVIFIPREVLTVKELQTVSVCFMLNLLRKVSKATVVPESGQLISGAILLMLESIKKCHNCERKQQIVSAGTASKTSVLQVHLGSMKEILENLIEWIMVSNVTDERLRVNLYTSLVTLLGLSEVETSPAVRKVGDSMYVSRLDGSFTAECAEFYQNPADTWEQFGEKIIDVMCQDCTGGYELSKMLALSSFAKFLAVTGNVNWIAYIAARGYLKFIVESIVASDKELESLLEPGQTSIKPLYVYMSKVLFLAKLATSRVGAELLLEHRLFGCFSTMGVFTYHPEVSRTWKCAEMESLLPPPEELYLQMWLPTLEMCNAILTTLGTDNQSAVAQVMHFVFSMVDVIEPILRAGTPQLPELFLKELALVTSILARTASNDLLNVLENPQQANRAQVYRLQKLTLSLLPKFLLTENTVKALLMDSENEMREKHTFQTSERLLYGMQIASNLLCYARNIVADNDVEHGGVGVLFRPNLSDTTLRVADELKSGFNLNEQLPSLGVIVQHLMAAVNYQHQEKFTFDLLRRKVSDIAVMENADIDEFVDPALNLLDVCERREYAYDLFVARLEKKQKEMDYCHFIIEQAMYLVWVHLDYYMLKAIPRVAGLGMNAGGNVSQLNTSNVLASASEATWKVSTDDISNLKRGLVGIFNDSFRKQLLEAMQEENELDKGFVDALLKKIIRLIQFVPVE